jgi:hypothetical protein
MTLEQTTCVLGERVFRRRTGLRKEEEGGGPSGNWHGWWGKKNLKKPNLSLVRGRRD